MKPARRGNESSHLTSVQLEDEIVLSKEGIPKIVKQVHTAPSKAAYLPAQSPRT